MTGTREALRIHLATVLTLTGLTLFAPPLVAQAPDHSRDRGPGQPTSMFGAYIERGQLLLYPFFEYYYDRDAEYTPAELGHTLDQGFRGRYHANEALLFVGYGFTDRLAVEFEMAVINARLQKASDDPSTMPALLAESGIGDVEGQLRWRWNRESERRPEVFSYFETVFATQGARVLIGTPSTELKLGTGAVRGFRWGTATLRGAVEYDTEARAFDLGELAFEYMRALSRRYRLYAGIEGKPGDFAVIAELQVSLPGNAVLKLNNAFGVTSTGNDWAPEVGVLWVVR